MVTYSIEQYGDKDFYRFNFSNGKYSSDKIIVRVSRLAMFMFCLEKGMDYKDGNKTIEFRKEQSYVTMIIHIPNRNAISYRLYDSERRALEELIKTNHL